MKYIFKILLLLFMPLTLMAEELTLAQLHQKVDPYLYKVEVQPDWLYSRLQMYWKSHATDVYISGETFDHVGGKYAPVPTVKFNGTRGTESAYNLPQLENVIPYDDDESGSVTYINRNSGKMEKTSPEKTGCNINTLNLRILDIALNAAKIYSRTGDTRYAKMAFDVFDVYLKGIYYRNVPIDILKGHIQTLVSMTTFEVIHEDAINAVTQIYALLGNYITKDRTIYDMALKKWADNIITNGVPHNNWDLFQAEFIARIALVLKDDSTYADFHGKQYYLDCIFNRSSIRQWSMKKLATFGFDPHTNIWYEAPGYSTTVLGDFCEFANKLDLETGLDMFARIPVLQRGVMTSPQYLFPNRMIVGFGDTHPNYLSTKAVDNLLEYALRHDKIREEYVFSKLKEAMQPNSADTLVSKYVSPLFYAPNVSWLVQRTGMHPYHDLMVSLNASLGNHQHANGLSMELYGKGYVLGPDAGIGRYLYSGEDYSDYYSQFPAHNTVCVDGISSYPVMMSCHAFKLLSAYPQPSMASDSLSADFSPVTYSELFFREPESCSDQVRTTGIVTMSDKGGYYVDIFRSHKVAGGDKTNDYFYHNLGQKMTLSAADGSSLDLKSTQELSFAGGHLYAYSYLFNKFSALSHKDIKATFEIDKNDSSIIEMTMWMKGSYEREVFKALSPVNLEYDRMPCEPYDVGKQPVLTFVARQHGEAWNHPFVAIYEPSSKMEPSEIASVSYFNVTGEDCIAVKSFAGICVKCKSGRTDYIFSAINPKSSLAYKNMKVHGSYAVISDKMCFLGNGTFLRSPSVKVTAEKKCSVLVSLIKGKWIVSSTGKCHVTVDGKIIK
jgi:hypothetical protein